MLSRKSRGVVEESQRVPPLASIACGMTDSLLSHSRAIWTSTSAAVAELCGGEERKDESKGTTLTSMLYEAAHMDPEMARQHYRMVGEEWICSLLNRTKCVATMGQRNAWPTHHVLRHSWLTFADYRCERERIRELPQHIHFPA